MASYDLKNEQTGPEGCEPQTPMDGAKQGGNVGQSRLGIFHETSRRTEDNAEAVTKGHKALRFFRQHPEFAEFIDLIREGVIGI